MVEVAPTRASLLLKIRDSTDQESWSVFVEIYGPLVFNFGRRCGLQDSDAADLVQEVMGAVAKSISKFTYDPNTGKFRNWLYKIAKRTMFRLRKKREIPENGVGGTDAILMLENQPDLQNDIQNLWDREYGQSLLNWAADKVRHQFKKETWQAFWLTAVLEKSPNDVASQLGVTVGAVYIARSRVLKRLSDKIREIDENR